jgi:hypothetical protein
MVYTLEPTTGIEPVNLILTKDVLYQLSYVGHPAKILMTKLQRAMGNQSQQHAVILLIAYGLRTIIFMERETGFEPATLSLEG